MAKDVWHGASSGGGEDVYSGAGNAMGAIGRIERYIAPLLAVDKQ